MKKILLIISLAVFTNNISSQTQSNAIIDGVGEFLTERAEDNFFYIFENDIKNNELFKYFFPNIYNIVSTVNLKLILTSKYLWEKSIKSDLEGLPDRIYEQIKTETKIFPMIEMKLRNDFLNLLQNAKLVYKGKTYPLNSSAKDDPEIVKTIINNLSEQLNNLITNIVTGLEKLNFENIHDNFDTLKAGMDSSIHLVLGTISEIKTLQQTDDAHFVDSDNLFKYIAKAEVVFSDIKTVFKSVEMLRDTSASTTSKVIYAFDLIKYIVNRLPQGTFQNFSTRDDFSDYFNSFKKIALFFAQLSDAKSSSEVKAILKSFTLPSVSFGLKREHGKMHLFVQSYWGITGGLESLEQEFTSKSRGYYGITAPIGLELSHGNSNQSSVSVFVSVVDFGQVVNSQIHDEDVDYSWQDLLAPGLSINYGLPEIPLAVGLGGYYGKSLIGAGQKEYHVFVHFSFDMPLMTLF
ncbi:MAG: hypothetical protein PVH88_15950 [Ignavibacteria bacterium]